MSGDLRLFLRRRWDRLNSLTASGARCCELLKLIVVQHPIQRSRSCFFSLVDSIESYKELNLGVGLPDYLCFWPFTTYGLHRASSTRSSANRRRATERLCLRDANRRQEQKTSKTACGYDTTEN